MTRMVAVRMSCVYIKIFMFATNDLDITFSLALGNDDLLCLHVNHVCERSCFVATSWQRRLAELWQLQQTVLALRHRCLSVESLFVHFTCWWKTKFARCKEDFSRSKDFLSNKSCLNLNYFFFREDEIKQFVTQRSWIHLGSWELQNMFLPIKLMQK